MFEAKHCQGEGRPRENQQTAIIGRASTVCCYGVLSGQVGGAHPQLAEDYCLAKGHYAEVIINVVRPSAMVKASAYREVQRDGLTDA